MLLCERKMERLEGENWGKFDEGLVSVELLTFFDF
jgi:hypothetical protein